ncbi:MAG: glutamate synthase-related protein [Nitrososphaerales archaeon]
MATQVASYIRIPLSRRKEFWNQGKIEHIRKLAESGRGSSPWEDHSGSLRVLDRVVFGDLDPAWSNREFMRQRDNPSQVNEIDTAVKLAYGRIKIDTPIYLGDMSFGALSGIPNIALARAADRTGVLTGTGEGGLNVEVSKSKRITIQWASGRFGVDIDVLKLGLGIVIKIGQGAKPGIGGHLPALKVTEPISLARRIPEGRDAISPAPHHDIYSIEDLGQRIWALKEATGKPVFVKVGATNYLPYIASGIARMGADGIIMDGHGAGTGAAPAVVKDNIGLPIDLAVSWVDRILREQGLRDGFSVIAAGMVSSAEDSAKLMALGADVVSIGTATLIGMGCLMVHKCHLGFCPAVLTNKIIANPAKVLSMEKSVEWTSNLIWGWQEELKWILRALGLRRAVDLIGRRDLIKGINLNHETAEVLGINTENTIFPLIGSSPELIEYAEGDKDYWDDASKEHLQQLSGTTGRSPGEAMITSMGSIAPPLVDKPRGILDWLICDGAQVTRPSIDPYREEIETACYLADGRIRLSSPFFFGRVPGASKKLREILTRVAFSMGLIFDTDDNAMPSALGRALFLEGAELSSKSKSLPCAVTVRLQEGLDFAQDLRRFREIHLPIFLRVPSSEEAISRLDNIPQTGISGILVDWDIPSESRIDIGISIAEIDKILRHRIWDGEPQRSQLDLLASGSRIRGAGDIFKLIALGADAVGISESALISIGYTAEKMDRFDFDVGLERLENLVLGLQKEVKLLAGAAGVSSVHKSLTGNRELIRSIDLDPIMRRRLDVKAGGGL